MSNVNILLSHAKASFEDNVKETVTDDKIVDLTLTVEKDDKKITNVKVAKVKVIKVKVTVVSDLYLILPPVLK